MPDINFADLLIWYVAFLFSATAHEASHALAALKGGDPTAYQGGQVTLNPIPHIERSPFGMVLVPIISFFFSGGWMIGWASAPYDLIWAERHPRKAALMAAAGPAANFVIATIALIVMKIGLASGSFAAPELSELSFTTIVVAQDGIWVGLAKFISVFFILNLILFVFNLFPVPPLDGSAVLTLFMPDAWAVKFSRVMRQPAFSFLGIVLAWRFFGHVFRAIFAVVFKLIHPEVNY